MHNHDDIHTCDFLPKDRQGLSHMFSYGSSRSYEIRSYLFKIGEEDTAQGQ